jgi:hypothetical protein
MDLNNAYSQAGITGSVIAIMGIAYRIYRGVNGKRCRCKICGYDLEADFKVDDMPTSTLQSSGVSADVIHQRSPPAGFITNPMVDAQQRVAESVCTKPTAQVG